MNHRIQILQCGQDFHMQRLDHHTLTQSYLAILRSWQRNKNYNTELDVKKNQKKKPHISLSQLSCSHHRG